MRRLAFLLAFVLAAFASTAAAETRRPVGLIQRLEVTSITRDKVTLWVRAALPHALRGSKQSFSGRFEIANVGIPFQAPARVMVQPGGGGAGLGSDAVFFLDVTLAGIPDQLLAKASAHALDPTLEGTLTGEAGETQPLFAVGVLRFGTPDVKSPGAVSPEFVHFGGAHLTDVSLSETSGEATVTLFNPFSFAVPIRELSYQLVVGDRVVASGARHAVRLRARQETSVALPVAAKNVDVAAAAGTALLGHGVLEGRLVGHITVKLSTGDVSVPINLPGRVEIGR